MSINIETKQFLRALPVYHEFKPTFSALVNIDTIQAKHTFYLEISEKLVFFFASFAYTRGADLAGTLKIDLPVPCDGTTFNAGMFGTNSGPVIAANNQVGGAVTNQIDVSIPDTMSGFSQNGEACVAFYYVRS